MKISFPLSLKVALWLLLNLLLLVAVGVGFFLAQSGASWNSLVSGPAGERVQGLANLIGGELSATPSSARDTVLTRFGAAYGVELYLFSHDGGQLAGKAIVLPAAVTQRLAPPHPRRGPRLEPQLDQPEPGMRRLPDENGPPPPREPPDRRMRFLLRAGEPAQYWIGMRLPVDEEPGMPSTPAVLIAASPSLSTMIRFLDWQSWLFAGVAVLGLSVFFWLPLVRSITHALGQLTAATERIAEGRFDTRVNESRRDELGRLGHAVNQMAERLETFVTGQKRFLGDVAHELCSPLARLQMAVGILEARTQSDPALAEAVADVRDEVQQVSALVNELLAFSKAGLRPREAALSIVPLAPLVARVLAKENAHGVSVVLAANLTAQAAPELLERALGNLGRTALRYGGGGPVVIASQSEGATVVLSVSDEGPGVPPESLARLGEPFYRPEAARTRESGGVGLGLAIVKSCADACRARLVLRNREPSGFLAELHLAGPKS